MKTLLIVESPAKAKKIQTYLGDQYIVKSSYGHICDLNTKKLKDMINNDFEPIYNINNKVLKSLKVPDVSNVILAADDDREGDAIAWHCGRLLNVDFNETNRIIFNEISKTSILHSLENKTKLNINSVNAQKCRQLLDLVIGYKLSPLLWKHIKTKEKGLSAGRVQSCLLKILIDHENEITNKRIEIKPIVEALFSNNIKCSFKSTNKLCESDIVELFELCIKDKNFKIISTINKEEISYSPPPFTTSSLQQTAYNELGFNVKFTMSRAQKLYESGLITYMRTDSTNISSGFLNYLQNHIVSKYGEQYYHVNKTKSNKFSQEAHEAIRPTNIVNNGNKLNESDKQLYDLIMKRTIQSHMSPIIYDIYNYSLSNELIDDIGSYQYNIRDIYFEGYLRYIDKKPVKNIKPDKNQIYILNNAKCEFKELLPPKFYNESMIVNKLESTGIGRPSTYSNIINTLYNRNYTIVKDIPSYRKEQNIIILNNKGINYISEYVTIPKERNKIIVTDLGKQVLEYLSTHFSMIINIQFTSDVERDLDSIANGNSNWKDIINKIYKTFNPIVTMQQNIKTIKPDKVTYLDYEIKTGKYGLYLTNGHENHNLTNYCKNKKLSLDDLNDEHVRIITSYPIIIGEKGGIDILIYYGRYGEYMKYNNKNYKVDKRKINNLSYLKTLIK